MLAALDVSYRANDTACAAVVAFANWSDDRPLLTRTIEIADVAPYQPGKFYLRELPCLLAALNLLDLPPRLVVIDGFVWLGDETQPGLGARLHQAMGAKTPIIGVAKTSFAGCSVAQEVYRGRSQQPLYVTAVGLAVDEAARRVREMHGEHRLPTLLKWVDRLSRSTTGTV